MVGAHSLPFGGSHLRPSEWTSRDSNHHRKSVSAGKTNAIPTEPSGRLVDFGSDPPSPHPTDREEVKSGHSSPTAQSLSGSADKGVTSKAQQLLASKGVILVSEDFTGDQCGISHCLSVWSPEPTPGN